MREWLDKAFFEAATPACDADTLTGAGCGEVTANPMIPNANPATREVEQDSKPRETEAAVVGTQTRYVYK